jgi:pimeloyl-ACP methyl ester carboxylesterase
MKLHFEAMGQGSPLIVLHGLLGSGDNWRSMSRRLAGAYQVFALDLRNHGQSPHSELLDYDVMAADLQEFVEDHGLWRIILMGHSMGGKVAMRFALDYGAAIERLVVVDVAPKSYPPMHGDLIEALRSLDLRRYRSFGEVDAALAPRIPAAAVRQFLLKNLVRDGAGGLGWKIDLQAIHRNYNKLDREISAASTFAKPSLFIRGARSPYVEDKDLPSIRRLFPEAVIATVPGAGHWVHADRPEEFYEILSRFLEAG